jgi:hypothetical protein
MVVLVVLCKKRNVHSKINIDQKVVDKHAMSFYAAAPPDRRYSFSGSALPFPNPDQAFEGSKNKGKASYLNGKYYITLDDVPNSFYTNMGAELTPPSVFVSFKSNGQHLEYTLQISDGVPFRTLNYHESRKEAAHNSYANKEKLPVRSQEEIFIDSCHPGRHVESLRNFWGMKPAI